MKKTHFLRLTILVMAACFIAGTALAAFTYGENAERKASTATLLLAFDAAADGQQTNGEPLNIRDMASDEVVRTAAGKAGVTGADPENIRKNLYIAGVYPADMAGRIGNPLPLLDTKHARETDVRGFRPTMFHVILYREAVPELSAEQRTALLGAILDTYRESLDGRTEVTALVSREPKLLSGDFVKKALRTALPLSALGFIVCVILLIRKRAR